MKPQSSRFYEEQITGEKYRERPVKKCTQTSAILVGFKL
jgi:hypothetical protein